MAEEKNIARKMLTVGADATNRDLGTCIEKAAQAYVLSQNGKLQEIVIHAADLSIGYGKAFVSVLFEVDTKKKK